MARDWAYDKKEEAAALRSHQSRRLLSRQLVDTADGLGCIGVL